MIIPFTITTDATFKDITDDLQIFRQFDILKLVNNGSVLIEFVITDLETIPNQTNIGIILNRMESFDFELNPNYKYWIRSNTSSNGLVKIFRLKKRLNYYSHYANGTSSGGNFQAIKLKKDTTVDFQRLYITSDKKITFSVFVCDSINGTPYETNGTFDFYNNFEMVGFDLIYKGYVLANVDKIITKPTQDNILELKYNQAVCIVVNNASVATIDIVFEFGI